MTVYAVALINIADHARYEPYMTGFFEIWKKYDGEILAVGDEPKVIEGPWPFYRTVILSFPNEDAFSTWYQSPDYQELVKHRHSASITSLALLEHFVLPDNLSSK
ncbi:DUF1330-domain-containing protein [Viridothelium virens]|uniref:DUF1330-domain-containing protein n=1 Tax=Viridothelium virens TaxID=1048519 RepID=A0A6A6GXQ4_VIRVR|nr:DUF1330-domain-containing protein [Viridothelium virens]